MTEKQDSATKMLSLHTRLKMEADKVRKWKIQTELDLKQKVQITIC
jgi:hypothetical protein